MMGSGKYDNLPEKPGVSGEFTLAEMLKRAYVYELIQLEATAS